MSRLIDAEKLYYDIVEKGQSSKRYKIGELWELNGAEIKDVIDNQPTVEPKLYGYDIKHLAMIATVMEKGGVTASEVVEMMNDIGRLVGMILEEMTEQLTREMVKK